MLFKFGCRNPQNCLQRFNVCANLADEQYDKQIISQLINLIGIQNLCFRSSMNEIYLNIFTK